MVLSCDKLSWPRNQCRAHSTRDHDATPLMLKPLTMRFCSTACADANAPDIMDTTRLFASVSMSCQCGASELR